MTGLDTTSLANAVRCLAEGRMSRSASVALTPDQRRIAIDILRAQLPQGAEAWVFGSRATGRARRYSDLDLAIDAGRRLTLDETARLAEAFSESDLPYRVDVIDWSAVDERFRHIIAAERLPLAESAPRTAPADIADPGPRG